MGTGTEAIFGHCLLVQPPHARTNHIPNDHTHCRPNECTTSDSSTIGFFVVADSGSYPCYAENANNAKVIARYLRRLT